jgi:adenylate cyclase
LPKTCAGCGAELPQEARFCDACGRPVATTVGSGSVASPSAPPESVALLASAPAPAVSAPGAYTPRHLAEKILTSRAALEGERKLVTVLFADVAGFTALSTHLDPEDLHDVMDGCFEILTQAIHRYEGTVNQFTGDGVMALFGAPIAHEDHAVRAVAASLALQRELSGYAARLKRERGLDFGLRVGLNTGAVVVGRIGDDLRMDYTAQGETVNLAARLQTAADRGGVMVSEATHRLVARYFETAERGLLDLKGVGHPVRAFAITGARTRPARFDTSLERGLSGLVGRARELGFLHECFERVREGRGQTVSLVGEAGTGKSRLAYELRRRLDETAVVYLQMSCPPHGEAAPFHLVTELLRALLRIEEGEPEAVQGAKVESEIRAIDVQLRWTVPYLRHLLALPAPELDSEGLDPAQRKRRTLEAARVLVERAACGKPQLLLAEDLQWIDKSSEEFLRTVVESIGESHALLLCTYRTGYVPPWHERSAHHRLALEPLSPEETTELAARLLPGATLADARGLVVRRAEGNPFFVEELALYLRDGTGNGRPTTADAEVPQTILDLLTARIDRLREPLKHTLQRAAVLGRSFPLRLLEAITPDGGDAAADVAALVSLELLHERDLFPELRLAFTQPLVREVAYQALLHRARAELHAHAGRALEQLYGDRLDEVLPDLARHFTEAAERDRALHYLVRAGDRAASLFAANEAETSYRRALSLVQASPELGSRESLVLERLGDVAFSRGEIQGALTRWSEALERAAPEERRHAADLHRKRGEAAWVGGERDRALSELTAGLSALGDDRENLEAARLLGELGRIHLRLGDNARATEAAESALSLGERLGAADVVSHAFNTLGVARARTGDLEGGAATVQKSLETALRQGLAAVACRAYGNLTVMYMTLDPRRSAEYCHEGLALARRIGDQLQQAWLYCAMAGGHCTLGADYDEGVKAAEVAIELDERLGQRGHLPIPLIILAQIYQCRGDYARSREYYERALAVAETIGEPQLLFPCYDGLSTLAIERGDDAEAEQWLARSGAVQSSAGWTNEGFFVTPFLC